MFEDSVVEREYHYSCNENRSLVRDRAFRVSHFDFEKLSTILNSTLAKRLLVCDICVPFFQIPIRFRFFIFSIWVCYILSCRLIPLSVRSISHNALDFECCVDDKCWWNHKRDEWSINLKMSTNISISLLVHFSTAIIRPSNLIAIFGYWLFPPTFQLTPVFHLLKIYRVLLNH